jgi:hypothetical protein
MGEHSFAHTTRQVADDALYRAGTGGGGGGGIIQLTGDVLAGPGTGSQSTIVVRVNGATVPAAGALTTGNVLQVTGPSALGYGPVNLALAAGVMGVLGLANGGTGLPTVGANGDVLTASGGVLVYAPPAAAPGAITDRVENSDFVVNTTSNSLVGFYGLTAERTGTLPESPADGQEVTFKSLDLSLGTYDFIIDGNGHDIDGSPIYTMTNIAEGPRGSITVYWDGVSWNII